MKKIPFMLIVGEKEQEEQKVSIRKHGHGDLGSLSLEEFVEIMKVETKI
jgi:threonyl-tRNA synthetase